MPLIDKCSCDEALHLREALKEIMHIVTHHTGQGWIADLKDIHHLADAALALRPLPVFRRKDKEKQHG